MQATNIIHQRATPASARIPGARLSTRAAALGAALWLAGCSPKPAEAPAASTGPAASTTPAAPGGQASASQGATAERAAGAASVVPDNDELRRLVVEAPLAPVEYRETVRVAASLQVDETRMAQVGSAVSGRVTAVKAQVGDRVGQGQPLASVVSTDLANAQMNYLQAIAQAQFHARAVERAQLLVSADVLPSAELQRRQADLASAEAALKAGRDYLRGLGMKEPDLKRLSDSRSIDSNVALTSTRAGMVIERKVTQGQVIQPSDPVFTVADLSTLWVVADVPEQLTRGLRVGEQVEVEVPSLGEVQIKGRLDFVAALVNPETRTVRVRMSVDNRAGELKPAMLASMLVKGAPVKLLAVPASAVVREGDSDHVFVRTDQGAWRMVRVRLGPENGSMRPVLDGLAEGQRIATQGAFHINAARKSALGG